MKLVPATPLLSLLMLIAVLCLSAQFSARAQQQDDQDVIRIQSDLVSFDVSVRDSRGLPVRGLKPADFIIYEDGKRQTLAHLDALETPFELVMILDTSLSTQQDIGLLRAAARNFINEFGNQDRIAIVQFNRDVELLSDFTSDHARLLRAIDQVGSGSQRMGSSVYDAMILAVGEELLGKHDGRKAVLMLSDGVDTSSLFDYDAIKEKLERSGAGFYFIEVDTEKFTEDGVVRDRTDPERLVFSRAQLQRYYRIYGRQRHLDQTHYQEHWLLSANERREVNHGLYELARAELREVAERTGGGLFPARRLQDLNGAYQAVIDELRTLYRIGYYPTRNEPDNRWHEIKVELKSPGATIHHRNGYWATK